MKCDNLDLLLIYTLSLSFAVNELSTVLMMISALSSFLLAIRQLTVAPPKSACTKNDPFFCMDPPAIPKRGEASGSGFFLTQSILYPYSFGPTTILFESSVFFRWQAFPSGIITDFMVRNDPTPCKRKFLLRK